MCIRLIHFTSVDSINRTINSLEIELNRLKNAAYSGFNYSTSFVNTTKRRELERDLDYLRMKRSKMRN